MKHFDRAEFACKCGKCGLGLDDIDAIALGKLLSARARAGVPFVLNSAMRCERHNKKIGGSHTSSHLNGCAFDIACQDSVPRFKILGALLAADFKRIGIAKTFIHVDDDRGKPAGVAWIYE